MFIERPVAESRGRRQKNAVMDRAKQVMRHSLLGSGGADRVPLSHVGGFGFLAVEAQLGADRAFHVFLRILALQQQCGVADAVVELSGGTHRLSAFKPLALMQLASTALS